MARSTRSRGGHGTPRDGGRGLRGSTRVQRGRRGSGQGWTAAVPDVQLWLLIAALVGAALLFWRGALDPFVAPKFAWLLVAAVALVASAIARWLARGGMEIPRTWLWVPLGVLLAGMVTAVATSPTPLRSVVGSPGRHTGAATYLAALIAFAVAVRRFRDGGVTTLLRSVVVIGAPVAAYALLQAAGVHLFTWTTFEGGPQVVSTFGNANFAAAWLGLTLPASAWLALDDTAPVAWRATGGAVTVGAGVAALSTGSLQGLVGGAAGVALLLAAIAAGWEARRRLVAAAVAVLVLSGAVLVLLGPARDQASASLASRTPKWEAALDMVAAQPLTGVGFDRYEGWYHRYREPDVAAEDGLTRGVDDAHAVPLQLAAGGGLLTATGYLVFVLGVAWTLLRGWRRSTGDDDRPPSDAGRERVVLAALGGMWLAYQVQSLVSIDVPPLVLVHFVVAGAIVAVAGRPQLRAVRLPGGGVSPPAAVAVAGVIGVAGLWLVTAPYRADLAAGDARDHATAGDVAAALDAYEHASTTAPWEDRYLAAAAGLAAQAGAYEEAIEFLQRAVAREPRDLAHTINLARFTAALGRDAEAAGWYARVLELDPVTPEVAEEARPFLDD